MKQITDDHLECEQPNEIGGVQRLYAFKSGYKLSAINSPLAHSFPYAWEFAVINPSGELDYSTELTEDVVVCSTVDEANEFIAKASKVLEALP